jgi:hypothetical protein
MHPGNVGGDSTSKTSLRPLAQAAAATYSLKGAGVDMQNFESCVLHVMSGVTSGTPDSFAVDCKLQESTVDTDGSYTDVATNPQNPLVTITQITTANADRRIEIDRRGLKRWVRPVFTVAFVSGTSPKLNLAATFVCGGAVFKPVSQS